MKFSETEIPGVIIIEPAIHRDDRGWFLESYQAERYREGGIDVEFLQDNHSHSCRGTLRGLHAQSTHPQEKLVRVLSGEIYDVAVDVRRGSPSFGKYVGAVLSAENFRQLFIPVGFVHGFLVTSESADIEYKCSDYYDPESEISIVWNDPQIGIAWPLENPLLSPKDADAPKLAEINPEELPRYHGE